MGAGTGATRRPVVNVFGAGISGLTVAHELAERGFVVRVIEPDTCLDRHGRRRIAVGGVARTQYAVATQTRAGQGTAMCASDARGMNAVAEVRDQKLVPIHVPFAPGNHEAPKGEVRADIEARVRSLLEFLCGKGLHVRLAITGYADPYDDAVPAGDEVRPLSNPEEHLELCMERAREIRSMLSLATDAGVEVTVAAASPGEHVPRLLDGRGAPHGRFVVLDVSWTVLPGEHGFRFFPSYYNHVFDTMRRIPLLDGDGNESGRTVYDNVVPTPNQGIVTGGLSPLIMPRSPPGSDHERGERLAAIRSMGYTASDLTQLMLRVTRYMSTCSERRAQEMERISWWEYLEGYDPDTGSKLYEYSERFQTDAKTQSRVLASFDAVWCDARTCGNTYVQLLYNWIRTLPKVDGTLSGPTTEAWLEPWRTYLERRFGVAFFAGGLDRLELEGGQIVPHGFFVNLPSGGKRGPDDALTSRDEAFAKSIRDADYHVVATDVCTAEEVTEPLRDAGVAVGVTRDLGGFTTRVRRPPPDDGEGDERPRAGSGRAFGVSAWDRLQTMSGLQFFFRHEVKINNGYVYFSQAPWGLTSINSAQFWTRRPTLERDGFVSLLSIDLCDWNTKATEGAVAGKAAAACTPLEIAEQVYAQIITAMRPPSEPGAALIDELPAPAWFHFDETMEFGENRIFLRAKIPYLVPIKGDYQKRPGPQPWDPSPSINKNPPEDIKEPGVWRAPHGGYLVHWDKLVFAGVYLKTFTRMSTMEAANESGRHAANAILDHHRQRWFDNAPPRDAAPGTSSEETRHMGSEVFYRSSPAGDYCAIWDMEHWELPEFAQAKQYDAWCLKQGLPHPWDILGIERIPSLVSKLAHATKTTQHGPGPASPDGPALDGLLEGYLRMAYPLGGAEDVLQMLRGIRKIVEETLKNGAGQQYTDR